MMKKKIAQINELIDCIQKYDISEYSLSLITKVFPIHSGLFMEAEIGSLDSAIDLYHVYVGDKWEISFSYVSNDIKQKCEIYQRGYGKSFVVEEDKLNVCVLIAILKAMKYDMKLSLN